MSENQQENLWRLLWEYDPNGLIVVDLELNIKLVNPAFCQLFRVRRENIIGQPVSDILGNVEDFQTVWETNQVLRLKEKEYPHHNLCVKKVIFPIQEENMIACIVVDVTSESQSRKEIIKLKTETVKKVNEVVDNQMKVVQEIASLLGETTGETKVSLLKIVELMEMVEQEFI